MKATALLQTGNWQEARSIFATLSSNLNGSKSDDARYIALYSAARMHGIDGDDQKSAEYDKRASLLNCDTSLRRRLPTQ
jgi:hypothetical protein